MNYKELWEQARALAFEEPVDMDGPLEGLKGFNQQVYEKFGELIVKECMTICEDVAERNDPAIACYYEIKRTFWS